MRTNNLESRSTPCDTMGCAIKDLRERRGLSLKELARAASVSEDYLSSLEEGALRANVITLARLGTALRVPMTDLAPMHLRAS